MRRIKLVWALAFVAACEEKSTGPASGPGLSVVQGQDARDTARANIPVVFELRDANNRPISGAEVMLQGDGTRVSVLNDIGVQVPAFTKATNAAGRVSFFLKSICPSGSYTAVATAPAHNANVTVSGAIRAGSGVAAVTSPADTVVKVGASYRITASFRDACGNLQLQQITLRGGNEAAVIDDQNRVTALAPGVAQFTAQLFGLSFRSGVSVSP